MDVPIPAGLCDDRFLAAWAEWKEYRRERKPAMTPRSAKMQLKRMAGWGPRRAVAAIEFSIAQGYQGIFEPAAQQRGASSLDGVRAFMEGEK